MYNYLSKTILKINKIHFSIYASRLKSEIQSWVAQFLPAIIPKVLGLNLIVFVTKNIRPRLRYYTLGW